MYNLVIVDDEKMIADGISSLFPWNQIGFEAISFTSGREALAYIKEHGTDVLMSDIEMPGVDGITLCQELAGEDIIIVLISSHQNYEYFRSAIKYQVEDYILKPLKSNDIIECFQKIKEKLDEKHQVKESIPAGYYDKIVDKVKEYVKENYMNATLEEAAGIVNLSSSYLSRLFKEKTDSGFADYLLMMRMEKAKELLMDINYKSYDIAYYIGYDNPKSFSRAFKAYYGITPMEYRKSGGLQE